MTDSEREIIANLSCERCAATGPATVLIADDQAVWICPACTYLHICSPEEALALEVDQ